MYKHFRKGLVFILSLAMVMTCLQMPAYAGAEAQETEFTAEAEAEAEAETVAAETETEAKAETEAVETEAPEAVMVEAEAEGEDGDDSAEKPYRNMYYKIEDGKAIITHAQEDLHYNTDGAVTKRDYCQIFSVTIPASIDGCPVTRIENDAFKNALNMSSLSLPEGLKEIGGNAFAGCTSLTTVKLPLTLTLLECSAFGGCTGLTSVNIPKGMDTHPYILESPAYYGPFQGCTSLSSFTFEKGITRIPAGLFHRCYGLQQMSLPITVTEIGKKAFVNCDGLMDITIPTSVTSIEWSAFEDCDLLTSVYIPNSVTFISCGAFKDCKSLLQVRLPKSFTTHQYMAANSQYPGIFSGCPALKDVLFAEGMTELPPGVFYRCTGIEEIELPDTVTTIGHDAFYMASNLKTLHLPESLKTLGGSAFEGCAGLTGELRLPESLTSIDARAFLGCSGIESVYIPKNIDTTSGVTSNYGNGPFNNCTSLKTVEFEEGIKFIPAGLFRMCSGIEEIELPAGLQVIEAYAFSRCPNLVKITFPDGLTEIEHDAFYLCPALKDVTFPESLTTFGANAFENCQGLERANFKGDAPEYMNWSDGSKPFYNSPNVTGYHPEGNATWTEKARNDLGIANWATAVFPVEYVSAQQISGDFNYKSHFSQETEAYSFDYDDTWFFNQPTAYNHDLVKMSLRMAMASMAPDSDATDASNIISLYKTLGFHKISKDYPATEDNTIGSVISMKNVEHDGKMISVVAVVIRGGGYGQEWGGNGMVGTGQEHDGFSYAAKQVQNRLDAYLKAREEDLADDVKIWICGYSRAGATTNILAKMLDDGSIKKISRDDVFAFCFEAPQTTKSPAAGSSKYDNIICILNPIDFVPKVPLSAWGFTRYGKNYFLPASGLSSHYRQYAGKMADEYKNILDRIVHNTIPGDLYTLPLIYDNYTMTLWDEVMDDLGGYIKDTTQFYNEYQTFIVETLRTTLGKGELADTFLAYFVALIDKLRPLALMHTFRTNLLLTMFTTDLVTVYPISTGMSVHFPELCLAWVDSLDGAVAYTDNPVYRKVFVNCPVDISVYDSAHQLAGRIIGNEPVDAEGSIGMYIDENDQKVLILPADDTYDIEITATGSSEMTYTATEYNMASGETENVVSYQNVKIKKGNVLTGTADVNGSGKDKYPLTKGSTGLKPQVDQSGSAVQTFTVEVIVRGVGEANGGGTFVSGEFAKLSVSDAADFRGWYENDKLLSEEIEYRFLVTKDHTITAVFEASDQDDFLFDDVSDPDKYYFDPVYWAYYADPQITTGTSKTMFSPDANVTRGQMVTFLWRTAGCPQPSKPSVFNDVASDKYYADAVAWAAEEGITTGYADGSGNFGPNDNCTREQIVAFLYRYAGSPKPETQADFTDTIPGRYYMNAVSWAAEEGITVGLNDGTGRFGIGHTCTRAMGVTFLYRYETGE